MGCLCFPLLPNLLDTHFKNSHVKSRKIARHRVKEGQEQARRRVRGRQEIG